MLLPENKAQNLISYEMSKNKSMLKAQKYAYFGVEDILKMKKNSEMNETMSHSRNKKSDILNSCANS